MTSENQNRQLNHLHDRPKSWTGQPDTPLFPQQITNKGWTVIKRILILILSFSISGYAYGAEIVPAFDPGEDFYDLFSGMLIEENNALYFKKCAIVSPNMKIVDPQGNEDKAIRALYEKSKKETSVIQLSAIANVKGVGKDDNMKYFINIKEVINVTHGESCILLDAFK